MNLDIIIPTYNEYKNLEILLPYLTDNIPLNKVKIHVVDASRSTKNILPICKKYKVNYIKSAATQRSIQMNEGADNSAMDYIFFLHADVLPPRKFYYLIKSSVLEGFDSGCFAYRFNSDKILLKVNSFFTRYKGVFTGGGDQGLFISRDRFLQLGGFCCKHKIMEDFEFYKRIKENKIPFEIIKEESIVSSRKYKSNSWIKVNLINLITLMSYKINPNPEMINKFYRRWLSD